MPNKDKKLKNKKYKQIKVKKDFTKIGIAEKLADKKVDKKCKRFYIFCFGILWCKVLYGFVKVMENFCVKSFCRNCEKKFRENVGKNLHDSIKQNLKTSAKHSSSSVVGVAGFKPTTSPTPRVRANQAAPYSVQKMQKTFAK